MSCPKLESKALTLKGKYRESALVCALPPQNPDPEWAPLRRTASSFGVTASLGVLNDRQRTRFALWHQVFITEMHWLYKKEFDPKHKIPGNRSFVKACEAKGNLEWVKLKLCKELHPRAKDAYTGWDDWFCKIIGERLNWILNGNILPGFAIDKPSRNGYLGSNYTRLTKKDQVEGLRAIARDLRKKVNPSDGDAGEFHVWNLLEHAIDQSRNFPRGQSALLLKELSQAYSSFATNLERNQKWSMTFEMEVERCIAGEKVIVKKIGYQRGNGRNTGIIPVVKQPLPEPLLHKVFRSLPDLAFSGDSNATN